MDGVRKNYRVIYGAIGVEGEHTHYYNNFLESEVYEYVNALLLSEDNALNYAFVEVKERGEWVSVNYINTNLNEDA